MKPIVTIGICVKNCAETISGTIKSIARQDFPHELMEIIFVDDGSKDDTLRIINSYMCKIGIKKRIYCNNKWRGLGESRNIVVDNAQGDYIIWVDGDMLLSKNYVRKMVEYMETHPRVGIAKGIYLLRPGPNLFATLEIYSRAIGALKALNGRQIKHLGTGGSIYRLKPIKEIGGFNKNIKGYGEDWDLEKRIRAAGWLFGIVEVWWQDYERFGLSYRELWRRYIRRGYDAYYLCQENPYVVKFHKMLPLVGLVSGLLNISIVYKKVGKKIILFLPFFHMFKMAAWCLGFLIAKLHQQIYYF